MTSKYETAIAAAEDMMTMFAELEPTSALKQAASDCGIPYGDDMGKFVKWAFRRWGIS